MNYNPEELKKYTKAELINVISSISEKFNLNHQCHENYIKEAEHKELLLRKQIESARDEGYRKFVEGNGEYLERFITEFIKENVSVELEESDYNWFKTQLYIDGERGQTSQSIHIGDYE